MAQIFTTTMGRDGRQIEEGWAELTAAMVRPPPAEILAALCQGDLEDGDLVTLRVSWPDGATLERSTVAAWRRVLPLPTAGDPMPTRGRPAKGRVEAHLRLARSTISALDAACKPGESRSDAAERLLSTALGANDPRQT